jgi:hypothetical protein
MRIRRFATLLVACVGGQEKPSTAWSALWPGVLVFSSGIRQTASRSRLNPRDVWATGSRICVRKTRNSMKIAGNDGAQSSRIRACSGKSQEALEHSKSSQIHHCERSWTAPNANKLVIDAPPPPLAGSYSFRCSLSNEFDAEKCQSERCSRRVKRPCFVGRLSTRRTQYRVDPLP